jgi:RNA polymerase sigma factor (TIGR02999 family)
MRWTFSGGRWEDGPVTDDPSREVSRILRAAGRGEEVDLGALVPFVYEELRGIARARMAEERPGHTLSATALVHEAYLRLAGRDPLPWSSRAGFYAAAAEAMRRILVEHARKRGTLKRGGGAAKLPLDAVELATREDPSEILAVEEALSRLEQQDRRMADVAKLRFFAGLSDRETADALGLSERTVRRSWVFARAWLQHDLRGD